ncbi:hypothetical protein [Mycolicibacterium anyangense]|uniref:hypothetical protein n=1 Tax=Mycolicibacterium anyangense TaxID=1431246 RepID=UPI0013D035F9|nr:hypothetical protein [Mycolicibacterium anyangense]
MASTRRHRTSRLRDPLSVGFEAHRGLLILRLRWHARVARRAQPAPGRSWDR